MSAQVVRPYDTVLPGAKPLGAEGAEVAILVPCYNEEASVASVVHGFQQALPSAKIYVYDNSSTDRTAEIARDAGAIVRTERRKGKGHVVRRMFADIEADFYIMVDGDATYHAPSAPAMLERMIDEGCDLVNAARVEQSIDAYRPGHRLGNKVLSGIVQLVFGADLKDMLSGYKVMSRRFVKSFPVMSRGFEIETELLVHALELRVPMSEVSTPYAERPEGSSSKLRTFHDGARILRLIVHLVKEERPLPFFSAAAGIMIIASIIFGFGVVREFLATGLVPRLPTALLSTGLMLSGLLALFTGFILDTVVAIRREMKVLRYLSLPGPQSK
jgi:glycosyltransferase involved in cell wall biosynthesis